MQYSIYSTIACVAGLMATVNSHMLMKTPKPYTSPMIDNSPLNPDGSNFPCKAAAGASYQGTPQDMPIGSTQTLSFTGSAVHGGGSCQVSITYENPPPKDPSKWMVIYSIEGGCPAKNAAGNLPEDPNGNGAGTYPFKIPAGLKTGTATLAWTWFNKIGNREMYMNCAPVSISGGSSKRDVESYDNATIAERDTSFPPMFTANIGNGCATLPNADLLFPNPGPMVDKFGQGTLTPPSGTCAGGTGGSAAAPAPSGSASAPASSAAAAPSTMKSAAVFAPVGSTTAAAMPTTMMTSVSMSSAAASTMMPPAASASPPQGAGAAGAQTPGSACTSEGMWNCLPDGKSFQQCASGMWSAVQQMATGMGCTSGQSMDLKMAPTKAKRSHRHKMIRHGSRML